jgi:hypothetical protein
VAQPENKANPEIINAVMKINFFILLLLSFRLAELMFSSQKRLNHPIQNNDGYDQQDMNKITQRIAGHNPQQPEIMSITSIVQNM